MKLIYIDVETTGLDRKEDDIIQLAGIIVANGVTEEFNYRIRPREGVKLSEGAYMAHKKTDKEIQTYPTSSRVFPTFMSMLKKYINPYNKEDKFFFVAYNSDFDMDFLRNWFDLNSENYFNSWFHFPSLDVMQTAALHLIGRRPYMKNFKLITVYEELMGHPMENAHDALADVKATKEMLDKILEKQKGF